MNPRNSERLHQLFVRFGEYFIALFTTSATFIGVLSYFRVLDADVESAGVVGFLVFVCIVAAISGLAAVHQVFRRRRVRLAQFDKLLPYLPLYVADAMGFFRREGLEIEYLNTHGDIETWRSVLSGKADVGVADPFVILDNDAGEGKVFGSLVNTAVIWGVSRGDRLSADHLHKRRFYSWNKHTTAFKLLRDYLKGLSPPGSSYLDIREIAVGTEFAALNRDPEAVVLMTEPGVSKAEMDGARVVFAASQSYPNFLCTGLFATASGLKSNREVFVRLAAALEESLEFIHSRPGVAIQLALDEFSHFDRLVVVKAMARLLADESFPTNCKVDRRDWSAALGLNFPESADRFPFDLHVDETIVEEAKKRVSTRNLFSSGVHGVMRRLFLRKSR